MKDRPNFLDSPYFVGEIDNWHLKKGAPKEVQKEFDEFIKNKDVINQKTKDISKIVP